MPRRASWIDPHVGARIRVRRTLLGMSQTKLGEAVGLTFQQIQKYERGANQVAASRLYQFGRVLDVPLAYFFEGLPAKAATQPEGMAESEAEPFRRENLTRRETLELVRAYYRIADPTVRNRLVDLIRAIGAAAPGGCGPET